MTVHLQTFAFFQQQISLKTSVSLIVSFLKMFLIYPQSSHNYIPDKRFFLFDFCT